MGYYLTLNTSSPARHTQWPDALSLRIRCVAQQVGASRAAKYVSIKRFEQVLPEVEMIGD